MKHFFLFFLILLHGFLLSAQHSETSKSICGKPVQGFPDINNKDISFLFWQDFDAGLMPPADWTLISGVTPQTWQLGDSMIYPPMSGEYFMLCRYDETYDTTGQDEKLFTPVISLSGLSDATMSFWFLFSRYWGITPNDNYDLQVLLSLDGGISFEDTLWTELSVDTSAWSSWQWMKAEIDLTSFTGQTNLQFCFRYVGFDGADAAIEDVAISFTTGLNEQLSVQLPLYPNPASELIVIPGNSTRTVTIFDIGGNQVFSAILMPGEQEISVSGLSAGSYILMVESEGSYKSAGSFIKY
jgi:hypothetical protein